MYYDYQTIRDVPKPGQIIFNDIKYNDPFEKYFKNIIFLLHLHKI